MTAGHLGAGRQGLLRAALLALALAAAGCSSLIPGANVDPPDLYELSPKSEFGGNSPEFPEELPQANWQLVVETPVAAASLDTARIALRRNSLTLEYYERVLWTDVAPKMVQTLVIESFENSGRIIAVGRETVGLRSDYVLKLDLREFQAEITSGDPTPEAHVHIIAKLVRMPERRIIEFTSQDFRIEAANASLQAVVAAFDEALGKALKRIVVWTLTTAPPR